MNQEEAERLRRAIERTRLDWIQVRGIEYNQLTAKYELTCSYSSDTSLTRWTELRIRSPRQWINVLTRRSGGLGGLELP